MSELKIYDITIDDFRPATQADINLMMSLLTNYLEQQVMLTRMADERKAMLALRPPEGPPGDYPLPPKATPARV